MSLVVTEIRSGYGRLEIVQGASLRVAPGEIVGIIGPNGAGKSTLLKTIFGYRPVNAGSIEFEGNSLVGLKPNEIIRLGIGFVAQAGILFPDMTVHENIRLGAYTLANKRDADAAFEETLHRFPIFRDRRRQIAGSLSGGQQRLLAVARALMVKPRLVLLDEPSAALSPGMIESVYDTLRELNRGDLSLLIVEQNVEAILGLAHRIYVLDTGRNAFERTSAALRESDRIRRLYLGEEVHAS